MELMMCMPLVLYYKMWIKKHAFFEAFRLIKSICRGIKLAFQWVKQKTLNDMNSLVYAVFVSIFMSIVAEASFLKASVLCVMHIKTATKQSTSLHT